MKRAWEYEMEATSRATSIQTLKNEKRTLKTWKACIFLFVLTAEIIGAYWIVYKGGAMMNDAMARTANAYYVFFLEPHKLASIGFVWNPLPSLVQLLIIPFARFWQPLASSGFAGSIATALFASANASLLFGYFKRAGCKTALSLLFVALYAFNPFIFYYGLNGMSETFFFTAMIICIANFALWMDQRRTGQLVAIGLMLAIGFLTRYEVFPLMLAVGLAMLIAIYLMQDRKSPFLKKPGKMKWDYSVATATVLFLPVLYTIAMWMFLNWTIMGDPLNFLTSAYSNESQTSVALYSDFKNMVSNPFVAFGYVLVRLIPFIPPFLVVLAERIKTKRLLKPDFLILVLFIGGLTAFHYLMLIMGKSFGWLRFFCFAFIFTVAWIPYELTQIKGDTKKWTIVFLCISMLFSAAVIPSYFKDEDLAREEYQTFYGDGLGRIKYQTELADAINAKYGASKILMDSFATSSVILSLEHPENLITNIADDLFDLAVIDPHDQFIDYVVVPTNLTIGDGGVETNVVGGVGALDAINREHPRLYRYGADWADLVYELTGFRIYKVLQWDKDTADLSTVVNENYSDAVLLFDNSTTGMLHHNLKNPKNAITLTSKKFQPAVEDPMRYGVEYIIVPNVPVDSSGSQDDILRQYPELMDAGTDWTELVYKNELYNVYRVIYPEGWVQEPVPEDEDESGTASSTGKVTTQQLEVSRFLNANSGRSLLLVDPEFAEALQGLLTNSESMFTNASFGFENAVLEPEKYQVKYMILPAEDAPGMLETIDGLLPGLYENGPAQSKLVFENDAYRVYEIIGDQAIPPDDGDAQLIAATATAVATKTAAAAVTTVSPSPTAAETPTVKPTSTPSATALAVVAASGRTFVSPSPPSATGAPTVTPSATGTVPPKVTAMVVAATEPATAKPTQTPVPMATPTAKAATTEIDTATVKPATTSTASPTATRASVVIAAVATPRLISAPVPTATVRPAAISTITPGITKIPHATAAPTATATIRPTLTPTQMVTANPTTTVLPSISVKPVAASPVLSRTISQPALISVPAASAIATAASTVPIATAKPTVTTMATATSVPQPSTTATMYVAVIKESVTARPSLSPVSTVMAAAPTATPTMKAKPIVTAAPSASATASTSAMIVAATVTGTPLPTAAPTVMATAEIVKPLASANTSQAATLRPAVAVAQTATVRPTTTTVKTSVASSATPKLIATSTTSPSTTATMHIETASPMATIQPTALTPTVTVKPTTIPTVAATAKPTVTAKPTAIATATPLATMQPAQMPTPSATVKPTVAATARPTATVEPTTIPTAVAAMTATTKPTPSTTPTITAKPTERPIVQSTVKPPSTAEPAATVKITATISAPNLPSVGSPAQATPRPKYLGWIVIQANNSANVRREDSVDSEVVHIVRDGDWYPVLSVSENGWYEIRISKDKSGFVSPKLASRIYRNSRHLRDNIFFNISSTGGKTGS